MKRACQVHIEQWVHARGLPSHMQVVVEVDTTGLSESDANKNIEEAAIRECERQHKTLIDSCTVNILPECPPFDYHIAENAPTPHSKVFTTGPDGSQEELIAEVPWNENAPALSGDLAEFIAHALCAYKTTPEGMAAWAALQKRYGI